jgi:hypothetical protein
MTASEEHAPTRAPSRPDTRWAASLTAPAFLCIFLQALAVFPDAAGVGAKSQCQSPLARDLTVSLVAPDKPLCVGGPIELVGALENVGDRDLLLADPGKCRTCLFFQIKDSSGRTVSPIPPKGPVHQIHESKPPMILLKAGSRAEFRRDITVRHAGMEQYWLAAGKHQVTATFINPGGFKTGAGTTAISGVVESRSLEITVGECVH